MHYSGEGGTSVGGGTFWGGGHISVGGGTSGTSVWGQHITGLRVQVWKTWQIVKTFSSQGKWAFWSNSGKVREKFKLSRKVRKNVHNLSEKVSKKSCWKYFHGWWKCRPIFLDLYLFQNQAKNGFNVHPHLWKRIECWYILGPIRFVLSV